MVDPAQPPVSDASRKRFLELMGGGAAAASLAGLLGGCDSGKENGDDDLQATTPERTRTTTGGNPKGDVAIVDYALGLEQVENAFYRRVVASRAVKDRRTSELLKQIEENEGKHLDALTDALRKLGSKPGKAPEMSFDAILEGGERRIVQTSASLENLGASAYLGQAAKIQDREVLAAALGIHTVESRHAAALNDLAGRGFSGPGRLRGSVPDGSFAVPRSRPDVLRQVKELLG